MTAIVLPLILGCMAVLTSIAQMRAICRQNTRNICSGTKKDSSVGQNRSEKVQKLLPGIFFLYIKTNSRDPSPTWRLCSIHPAAILNIFGTHAHNILWSACTHLAVYAPVCWIFHFISCLFKARFTVDFYHTIQRVFKNIAISKKQLHKVFFSIRFVHRKTFKRRRFVNIDYHILTIKNMLY